MDGVLESLRQLEIFGDLDDAEIGELASAAGRREFGAGDVVYSRGGGAEGMYVVLEGAVELFSTFAKGVERVFGTLRPGQAFGFLALMDGGPRPATARAVEPTRTLFVDREAMERIRGEAPVVWAKIVGGLGVQMASQIRLLVEQYRQCVEWGLEVSGCAGINLDRLMAASAQIEVELLNGSPVRGVIVGVEKEAGEYELLIRSDDGKLRLIPGHAVLQIVTAPADLGPVLGG